MSQDEIQTFLDEMHRTRGYTLEMHRIMAHADLQWLKAYTAFLEATYTDQRLLDRKTKELLRIAVETALQAVIAPMGALAFRRGIQAWAEETGLSAAPFEGDAH